MDISSILITGASGMVGRNLAETLNGWKLFTPSRRELDLLDNRSVCDWLSAHKPDLVIHCAGKVGGIRANMEDPVAFYAENALMGINIVMSSLKTGIRNFLNLGSSCMYPANIMTALSENMILSAPLEPTNEGYAIAKSGVARLCQYISRQYHGNNYKTFIPCNLYGKYEKFDVEKSHLIAAIIMKLEDAINNNQPDVEIWGDGLARREFMHVEDLCNIIKLALTRFDELPDMMNLGMGKDYTINEYYSIAADVLGYNGKFTHNLEKPGGMRNKLLDISLQKEHGFLPKIDIHDGIKKTYEYYKEL